METIAPGGALDVAAVSHYRLIAPAMDALFGPIPVVWTNYPYGPERAPQWHVHYFGHYDKLSARLVEHLTRSARKSSTRGSLRRKMSPERASCACCCTMTMPPR